MKIQVRELMIGNMILVNHPDIDKGILAIIKSISETTCWVKDPQGGEFEIDNDFLFPIPLTEEWLVRFGFEWYAQIQPKGYWMNGFCIEKIDSMLIHYKTGVGLKYVHKLQNLFHAVTGQELTLKAE